MDDNFPAAAKKHVGDSELLFANRRFDGAAYLAGYAVECVLKTLILADSGNIVFTHNLNNLSAKAISLAGVGSRTAKYLRANQITSLSYGDQGWRETMRYEPEGTVSEQQSRCWVQEGKRMYDQIVRELDADGVLADLRQRGLLP